MRKDEIAKETLKELTEAGTLSGFQYDHFRSGEAVPTPFAVYRRVAQENMGADDKVFFKGGGVDIEIYADTPEEMAGIMEAVEKKLDAREVFYQCTADTVYIDPEDFYESLYEL